MVITVCATIQNGHCTTYNRENKGLTQVPTDIPTNVTELELRNNQLTALRDCEFCLYTQLEEIFLSWNEISVIRSSAFQNTRVSKISLSYNQLTVVPDLNIVKHSLSNLYLAKNSITSFDGEVCSGVLKRLDLWETRLRSIEASAFDACTALKILRLQANELTTLAAVPFETLEEINLTSNPMVCDASLLWLKDAQESGVYVYNFICAGPACLQGRSFYSLSREELDPLGKLRK